MCFYRVFGISMHPITMDPVQFQMSFLLFLDDVNECIELLSLQLAFLISERQWLHALLLMRFARHILVFYTSETTYTHYANYKICDVDMLWARYLSFCVPCPFRNELNKKIYPFYFQIWNINLLVVLSHSNEHCLYAMPFPFNLFFLFWRPILSEIGCHQGNLHPRLQNCTCVSLVDFETMKCCLPLLITL